MNSQSQLLFEHIKMHYEAPSRFAFMDLSESSQVNVGRTLIDKVYVTIAEKYNDIDFESIPNSKGHITKMTEYKNLKESIQLLQDIVKNSQQNIPEIATLAEALNNMELLSDRFYMGFVKKSPNVIMLYNILAMAIYCGTSLMISTVVDYVNLGNTDAVEVIINKKYKKSNSYLMIDSLKQFNQQMKDRSFIKMLEDSMNAKQLNESFLAGAAVTGIVIAALFGLFKIIPLTKELIYLFYYSRMKMSEACEIQANLIEANIKSLESANTKSDSKVIRIQKWFAEKLQTLSDKFAFTYEKNEKKAQTEAAVKVNQNDIVLF